MQRLVSSVVVAACVVGTCGLVHADMLTFDDIIPIAPFNPYIPDGYGGLQWTHFGFTRGPDSPGTGMEYGTVSGEYVAYNIAGGWPGQVWTYPGTTFDFNGAYLTSVPYDPASVRVVGFRGEEIIYDRTVPAQATVATWFEFNYVAIDLLKIEAGRFAMDNFTFNEPIGGVGPVTPVPIPGAVLLGAFGLASAGWRLRQQMV